MTVTAMLLDSRYSLDEEIGAGGFCEVWRGADTILRRPIAVKLLRAGYAHQPEVQARFKAEARHAGALSHENVARVYDYGESACGQAYLVMELLKGPSLATVMAAGPLDAARTMDIVAQVAAGLQAAHSAGLIHRDIKPANILFTSEGTARITDFGIAYAAGSAPLTATGMVMGTPGYIAPEQVAGTRARPASDLYALGIVAFECLTGAQPFSGPPVEVAIAHRDRPLPPLPASLPAEVADFVMVLTAKDPAWRPANAGQVASQARMLRDRLDSGAIRAQSARVGESLKPARTVGSQARAAVARQQGDGRSRRRPQTLAAAALVALAALTCLMLLTATRFAPASHPAAQPSSVSRQAAPPTTKPSSAASPTSANRPGQQPSAIPNARTGAIASAGHIAPRHPTSAPPGLRRHKNHPGRRHGPPPGPGHRHGPGPGHGHGPGPGPLA